MFLANRFYVTARQHPAHICLTIPLDQAISHAVGYGRGWRAITIIRDFGDRQRNFTGGDCWARGYFASNVGLDERMVGADICNEGQEEQFYDEMKLGI